MSAHPPEQHPFEPPTYGSSHHPEPAGHAAPSSSSSGKATASLVLGIVGVLVLPIICSVLALIFGYQVKREPGPTPGTATAGIVLGWIGLVLGILGVALVIVVALTAGSTT